MKTKIEPPVNPNYAATIIRLPEPINLDNLDNLRGVPVFGCQALIEKTHEAGELMVAFTAETQLSDELCKVANLYRHAEKNADPEKTGYLDDNRRVRAIKLRGERSDALVLPISCLTALGIPREELVEGLRFDSYGDKEICRKYVIKVPKSGEDTRRDKKLKDAFRRVDEKMLPEHISTDSYYWNRGLFKDDDDIVVTMKAHGTSVRISNTTVNVKPTLRQKIAEKILKVPTVKHDYGHVVGSRKVIKEPGQDPRNTFYGVDVWNNYAKELEGRLPQGVILYAEIIGWATDDCPIQRGYTYEYPNGTGEIFVYRVSRISPDGYLTDLSWDAVKEFCRTIGIRHVPELWRGKHGDFNVNDWMNKRYADMGFDTPPLAKGLSDEGIVIRKEGLIPTLAKAKCSNFLLHETELLDRGIADAESAA